MKVRNLLLGLALSTSVMAVANDSLAISCESQFSNATEVVLGQRQQQVVVDGVMLYMDQFVPAQEAQVLQIDPRVRLALHPWVVTTVQVGKVPGRFVKGINHFVTPQTVIVVNTINGEKDVFLVQNIERFGNGEDTWVAQAINKDNVENEFYLTPQTHGVTEISGKDQFGKDFDGSLVLTKNPYVLNYGLEDAFDVSSKKTLLVGMNINEAMIVPGGPVWVNTVEWMEAPMVVQNGVVEMKPSILELLRVSYTDGTVETYFVSDYDGDEGKYTLTLRDQNRNVVASPQVSFDGGEYMKGNAHMSGLLPKGTGVSIDLRPIAPVGLPQPQVDPPVGLPQPGVERPVGLPQPGVELPVGLPQPGLINGIIAPVEPGPGIINGIIAPPVGLPFPSTVVDFAGTKVDVSTYEAQFIGFPVVTLPAVIPKPLHISSVSQGYAKVFNSRNNQFATMFSINYSNGAQEFYFVESQVVVDGTTMTYNVINQFGAKANFESQDRVHGGKPYYLSGQTASGFSFDLTLMPVNGLPVGLPFPGNGGGGPVLGIQAPQGLPSAQ